MFTAPDNISGKRSDPHTDRSKNKKPKPGGISSAGIGSAAGGPSNSRADPQSDQGRSFR